MTDEVVALVAWRIEGFALKLMDVGLNPVVRAELLTAGSHE